MGGGAAHAVNPAIFRAYDIRGLVDRDLTDEALATIGRAAGALFHSWGARTIVVGRDARISSPRFEAALIAGLRAVGLDVIDIGQVPTPVMYFAVAHLGADGGAVVSASHNPPEYNGVKLRRAHPTFGSEPFPRRGHPGGWAPRQRWPHPQCRNARRLSRSRRGRRLRGQRRPARAAPAPLHDRARRRQRRGWPARRARAGGRGRAGAAALHRARRALPQPPPRPAEGGESPRPQACGGGTARRPRHCPRRRRRPPGRRRRRRRHDLRRPRPHPDGAGGAGPRPRPSGVRREVLHRARGGHPRLRRHARDGQNWLRQPFRHDARHGGPARRRAQRPHHRHRRAAAQLRRRHLRRRKPAPRHRHARRHARRAVGALPRAALVARRPAAFFRRHQVRGDRAPAGAVRGGTTR